MNDPRVDSVYNLAMGFGSALIQHSEAVDELVSAAKRDRGVLEEAHRRIHREAAEAAAEETAAVAGEEVPEAPALLATRLLADAIEELEGEAGD